MQNGFEWDIGTAVFSDYDSDGFVGVAVSRYGGVKSACPPIEVHHPYGFFSRPLDPDVDGNGQPTLGCNVLYATEGDKLHAWLGGDPRIVSKLPEVQKGESFMYGGAGQFVRCHADGSISLFTSDDGTPQGRSIYFKISPKNGFEMNCPWGRLTLGPLGFHVLHSSGARLDLGAIGGLPGPLSSLSSYAKIEGGVTSVKGGAVSLGTDGGVANEAAVKALVAVLGDITACIGALATDLGTAQGAGKSATATIATLASAMTALNLVINGLGKVI